MNHLDSGVKAWKTLIMMIISGVNTLSSYAAKLTEINQTSEIFSIKPNLELLITCMEKSGPNLEFLGSLWPTNN